MTDFAARRNFLRGRFSRRAAPLRPPWAIAEEAFRQSCTRCGDCRAACPTRIISDRDGGYPILDFAAGECTFCGACVDACRSAALQRADGQAPWSARAVIGERCLAAQQVECRICGDHCEAAAIRFVARLGGIAAPLVDAARCSGCGACLAPCPTRAIVVEQAR
ncbi:MAG: ferredoxin-type protein NapF [Candidatus Accumulibacter sp.]|uniref:ferredoxin-type protein NapF n=1 Tax=Accumulibacter sp. TaxID=2053492 RepID=UPI001A07F95A|nr:ferredoxin-type protein NapF [Accumulibacter sp.]MBE2257392.1 ferredoxin-type protein NapF [Paracoccaceae bacterium]MCB1940793.1 ferredoxin-type protein NapF [Accumulibacter sp.]MCP5249452.1 ferredoxin-type protein NapF [Accumulibacter sp.]